MSGPFGSTSTTDEVLQGLDLSSKRILVTGVSGGLGVETARTLAAHGAQVVGAARNLPKAETATEQVRDQAAQGGKLELVQLDLASLGSVRACADALLAVGKPFDLVIANAGVMAGPQRLTVDGFEAQFATNYLGHFVLINRIASLLKPGGRVVMVASAGHRRTDVHLDDPNFERNPYQEYMAYGRSKTATILFAVEFDRRHSPKGFRATAVHPGAVMTETVRGMIERLGDGREGAVAAHDWKTVPQGAATALWAGIVAPADTVGGQYCEDCRVAEISDDPNSRIGIRSYALDRDHARALWVKSEEMVRERF
nr:SDR family NAD(P)-dependent oxidoreductase [uncultured Lichenicoccus sp.]